MKTLFLVTTEITVSHYMSDKNEKNTRTNIVWANNENDARDIVIYHYEMKSRQYTTTYIPEVISVTEALGSPD